MSGPTKVVTFVDWPDTRHDQRAAWARSLELTARWPYGPPLFHERCCRLHDRPGECDCKASDESDDVWGNGA